jgi:hypothetical protein
VGPERQLTPERRVSEELTKELAEARVRIAALNQQIQQLQVELEQTRARQLS